MDEQKQRLPYLIQRIDKRFSPPLAKKGIDALFGFDYMGSAEFEWGALPKSLRALRELKKAVQSEIKHDGKVAFYVGPEEGVAAARLVFADQLGPKNMRLKEPTYIDYSYDDKEEHRLCTAIGWWAIDEDKPGWVLFKNANDAKAWKAEVHGG